MVLLHFTEVLLHCLGTRTVVLLHFTVVLLHCALTVVLLHDEDVMVLDRTWIADFMALAKPSANSEAAASKCRQSFLLCVVCDLFPV